jgi:hypothetical protein
MVRILVGDMTSFSGLPESTLQGWIDKIVLLRTMIKTIAFDSNLQYGDIRLLVPETNQTLIAYYGNSQGGILGGGYFALSPDHTRAVLGVPGTPYPFLLGRSKDFEFYRKLLSLSLYTWRHIRIAITLMGSLWDKAESSAWISEVRNAPNKQVLIQDAIGDQQVTTLGAHIMARGYGASTITPQTRPIYGIPQRDPPLPPGSNAIVEWQFLDVGPEPSTNIPPPGPDTHERTRRERTAQDQMNLFFLTGIVDQFCPHGCIQDHCKE